MYLTSVWQKYLRRFYVERTLCDCLLRWLIYSLSLLFFSPQFGHWQPWELNPSFRFLTLPKWMKLFSPMALLEVYSLTTFGMFCHPYVIHELTFFCFYFNLPFSAQGTVCGVDNPIGGYLGHVAYYSSCYGGWHDDPWPSLFNSLHSWLNSGMILSHMHSILKTNMT